MGGDKNDYVDSDPHNFETYESFNGEEVGTMVYELDLNIIDHFLAASAPVNAPTIIPPVASYEELPKPKKPAASARNDLQGYDRHARSFSGGPEDFATPQASARGSPSPERTQGGGDNFVEVDLPSTTISQVDDDPPYDTTSLNQPQEVTNGHVDDEPFRRRSLDPKFDDHSGAPEVHQSRNLSRNQSQHQSLHQPQNQWSHQRLHLTHLEKLKGLFRNSPTNWSSSRPPPKNKCKRPQKNRTIGTPEFVVTPIAAARC